MITICIHNPESHLISQKDYDNIIATINPKDMPCTCGQTGCLIRHGSYMRTMKSPEGEFRLRICRMKCTACGHTHALLLSSIITYSQIPLADTLSIIANYEDSSGHAQILSSSLSIDENNICAVILRYRRYWRKCIHLHQMLRYSVSRLIEQCFSTFGKQFMQIKNTANIAMFFPHNITGA